MREIEFIQLLGKVVKKGLKPIVQAVKNTASAQVKQAKKRLAVILNSADDLAELAKEAVSGDLLGVASEAIDILTDNGLFESVSSDIKTAFQTTKTNLNILKEAATNAEWRDIVDWDKYANEKKNKSKSKSQSHKTQNDVTLKKGEITVKKVNKKVGKEKKGTNHPEWYMKDKTLIGSLLGINISNRQNAINNYMRSFRYSKNTGVTNNALSSIPSCAALKFELTIPKTQTNDWQQGINMLYKNVRSANSGAINGSPAQYANYVYSIRSIDALLSVLGRAIKLLNSGSFYDAKSPQAMFAAMGLDYDSFANNAANARELYNRLSAIRYRLMPLNVTLLDRTRWLFGNIFADSNDAKAQVYVPTLDRVYFIDSQSEISVIDIRDGISDDYTGKQYDDFANAILKIFNLYQNDSVFQIIAGDIIKAYGKESLNKYPDIASAETLKPVYDEHVLTQIQNATLSVTGNVGQSFGFDGEFVESVLRETLTTAIDQSYNTPINPTGATEFNRVFVDPIYNSNVNVVDPGKLLSSTRLMVSRHVEENAPGMADSAYIDYDVFGTEVLEEIEVILVRSVNSSQKYGLSSIGVRYFAPYAVAESSGISGVYLVVPAWTWFDYFPYVVPFTLSKVGTTTSDYVWAYSLPIFDFNNFGIVYKSNLESYNAICTLSMLHKDFVARVNKTEVLEV